MNGIKTTFAMAGVCLAVAVVSLLGATPTAQAAVDQTCLVNEVATFSQPVTNTPQTVTVTVNGQLFNCTSGSASTGSYTETATLSNYTCTALFYQGSGTRIFTWTNSAIAPSTLSYNRTSSRVGGNVEIVLLGSIVSGTFTPEPAKVQLLAVQPNPIACATTGVSQLTLAGALIIGI
jgi:hypothetical protein